jgi:ankyrin repeat protein
MTIMRGAQRKARWPRRSLKALRSAWIDALWRAAIVLVFAFAAHPAAAHETDQFGLPIGREFADLGDFITEWAYGAVDRGVSKLNRKVDEYLKAGRDPSSLYTPDAVADAVCHEFPMAVLGIEQFDRRVHSSEWFVRYPGRLPGFEPPPTIEKILLYPLNPLRAWNCSTVKAYGVLVGTDKIGHFTDMGYRYFREYRLGIAKRETEDEAFLRAIRFGSDDPIMSESGLLGYWSAGAYSNADMASNFLGMVFYRNLTEPQMLKGEIRPPMIERDGPYFRVAPHVTPQSDFFSWYFSDHLDEAFNPSLYLEIWREGMRDIVDRNATSVLENRLDQFGNRRPAQFFRDKATELRTYWGVDYGHRGSEDELLIVDGTCFPPVSQSLDPAARDRFGRSPLHIAAEVGDVERVAALIDARADINLPIRSEERRSASWGDTPLHLAAVNGQVEAAELLLAAGADVNASNDRGAAPVHVAVLHHAMMRVLIDAGADLDQRDKCNRTALHWAVTGNLAGVMALLVQSGADPDARDVNGRTALHEAISQGRSECAIRLLQLGAQASPVDAMGLTPLHVAAAKGNLAIARALIDAGADVNAVDRLRRRPLHEATSSGQRELAALLLQHGGDPALADIYDQTPARLAARRDDVAIEQLFVDHLALAERQMSRPQGPTATHPRHGFNHPASTDDGVNAAGPGE